MTKIDPTAMVAARVVSARALLQRFFAAPNCYSLPVFNRRGTLPLPEELRSAIERFSAGHSDRPLLMPMLLSGDDKITWVACSHDERAHRTLESELSAILGPTFCHLVRVAVEGPTERAIRTAMADASLYTLLLRSNAAAHNVRVAQLWGTYWHLLEWQPPRPSIELRSFAQLRAAFDRSLLAKDDRSAIDAMTALREIHGLTAENRAFLEIRMASAFGHWEQILAHRQLSQVLQLRLPPETYGDLWDALYEVHLRPLESQGQLSPLLARFEQDVLPLAAPLLRTRGSSRRPAALKGLVLGELSQRQPSHVLLTDLLGQLDANSFGASSIAVAERVRALQPRSSLEIAHVEMDLERYEQAYALLVALPASFEVLTSLLRCVREIDDPQRAFEALQRLEASSVAAQMREQRPKLVGDLQALAKRRVTAEAAIAAVRAPAPAQTPLVAEVALSVDVITWWRETARAEPNQLLIQPGLVDRLVEELEAHALEGDARLDSLLPIWFEWVVERTPPDSRMLRVYKAFIEALYVRDQLGNSELELMMRAALHLLHAGPRPEDYRALIELLTGVFGQVRSPRALDWALDIGDALATAPCRDEAARVRWMTLTIAAAEERRERLLPVQRALLRLLAKEQAIDLQNRFNEPAAAAAYEASHSTAALRILIYSLDAQANQRAATALGELLPLCRIDTNEDETCTPRLHSHARAADFVAFVSTVATHPAFYCIKEAISSAGALIQIRGSGTTRIVGNTLDAVRNT